MLTDKFWQYIQMNATSYYWLYIDFYILTFLYYLHVWLYSMHWLLHSYIDFTIHCSTRFLFLEISSSLLRS